MYLILTWIDDNDNSHDKLVLLENLLGQNNEYIDYNVENKTLWLSRQRGFLPKAIRVRPSNGCNL